MAEIPKPTTIAAYSILSMSQPRQAIFGLKTTDGQILALVLERHQLLEIGQKLIDHAMTMPGPRGN